MAASTNAQTGGAFVPSRDVNFTGAVDFSTVPSQGDAAVVTTTGTQTLTNKTLTSPSLTATSSVLTTPVIDGVTYSAANDRQVVTTVVAVDGDTVHAAVTPLWVAPAGAVILRVLLNITTVSTGASTINVGYTAVSATTASDTLLDGIDGNAATGLFDSMNAALDTGANAHAQLAASGKWITIAEATGDTSGLVGTAYIQYVVT